MNPFERILILFFAVVQWRITVSWFRWANRRFSGLAVLGARATILGFDLLLLAGAVLASSDLIWRLGIHGRSAMLVGAMVLAYLSGATCLVILRAAMRALHKPLGAHADPSRRRLLTAAGNALIAAPVAVIGYGALVERSNFRVRELDVPFPGLPHDLDGLRILHLSDIHLSAFLREPEFARVIDAAIELRPHLAVVTGDLISYYGDPLDACIRQLARLKADAGVFGCLGNHERYARAEDLATTGGARAGIRFLRHQAQPLRFGSAVLHLAGVDYQAKSHGPYLAGAGRLVAPGAFNVLLSHNPDVFPVAARQGYDLTLAGHTHGGQVNIEILDQAINPARFFTPYVYGLYRQGRAAAYVTRGIGTVGIPARIGAPPEISVVRLRKA